MFWAVIAVGLLRAAVEHTIGYRTHSLGGGMKVRVYTSRGAESAYMQRLEADREWWMKELQAGRIREDQYPYAW